MSKIINKKGFFKYENKTNSDVWIGLELPSESNEMEGLTMSNEQKYTAGKLEICYSNDENTMIRAPEGNGCGIAIFEANWTDQHKANAERVVSLWNAMQGIEDPEKFVNRVKQILGELEHEDFFKEFFPNDESN